MLNNISDILPNSLPRDHFHLQFQAEDSVSRISYWLVNPEDGSGSIWSYTMDDFMGIFVFDGSMKMDLSFPFSLEDYYILCQTDRSAKGDISSELYIGDWNMITQSIPGNAEISSVAILFPRDIMDRLNHHGIQEFCTEPLDAEKLFQNANGSRSDAYVHITGILRQMKQFRGHGSSVNLWYFGMAMQCLSFLNDAATKPERENSKGLSEDDLAHLASVEYYLNQHYMDDVSLEDLTKIACMGITKLKYTFKSRFGCTIITYLQRRRMQEAKRMLESSDRSIKEIASLVGYQSSSRFSHLFREEYGMTPLEFRKRRADS